MERICQSLKNRIQTPAQAAQLIKSGMTLAMSGFTIVGYPKAVPLALAESGHARDLTVMVGASSGDELDGAMTRAGIVSRRFAFQNNKDLRNAINAGKVGYMDYHLSDLPRLVAQAAAPKVDVAIIECTAVTEEGLIPTGSVGTSDVFAKVADKIIVEINRTVPLDFVGLHDIYEISRPPCGMPIPLTKADDRIGTHYIPCPLEKIAAIVYSDTPDQTPKFKPLADTTRQLGENVVKFLKSEVDAGRLPKDLPPLQSGLGSVGNAMLYALADSEFRGLKLYTEVIQDGGMKMLENGVLSFVSATSLSLSAESRQTLYDNLPYYKDKIIVRSQEMSNHPELIRRMGVIAINTPIEVDIYGNVNSTHIMGTSMMNGIGGSGDFTRNSALNIFTTESCAKGGLISCIVPMVSHVDNTEHDVHVIITEQGVADLRWKSPKERAEIIIENCAHPDYRPMLREYFEHAKAVSKGQHTPHDLTQALSWHQRYLETGTMKK